LRFEAQQFARVGHFGVPTGGKVLALPAIHLSRRGWRCGHWISTLIGSIAS